MVYINRRRFLKTTAAISMASGTSALATLNRGKAYAADVSGYKALVCVFLKGGIDHADTVLPYDQSSYDDLKAVRPNLFDAYAGAPQASSRDRSELLSLSLENGGDFPGRQFALPYSLEPLHSLFEAGDAAIIGSLGPLIEPTRRLPDDSYTGRLPKRLFSHNDQQSTWMSLGTEGSQFGWGGRFADAAIAANPGGNAAFTAISATGNDVFLAGAQARPYRVNSNGPESIRYLTQNHLLGSGRNSTRARQLLAEHFASSGINPDNLYMQDLAAQNARGIESNENFRNAYENAMELTTEFPDSSLGRQLKSVAETISIQNLINVNRQVFYVSTGGFDSHNNQANSLPGRQSDIASSMAAFHQAMTEIGMQNNVTSFTASDFGRTLISNGDGTDHGWGGHHFVVGGAVNGKRLYGEMPSFDLEAETYTKSRGRLIPSVSVDQYAATLGNWFGLDSSELNGALPNLSNFTQKDLGFMQGGLST